MPRAADLIAPEQAQFAQNVEPGLRSTVTGDYKPRGILHPKRRGLAAQCQMTNDDDNKTGQEKHRLTSEDAARVLSPDAGWTRPPLTREQENELLALIRPTLNEDCERRFRWFVNRIFAVAVERYIVFTATPRVYSAPPHLIGSVPTRPHQASALRQ